MIGHVNPRLAIAIQYVNHGLIILLHELTGYSLACM